MNDLATRIWHATMDMLLVLAILAVILAPIFLLGPCRRQEQAEPVIRRTTWCPAPEQRAAVPEIVTDDGAVVEEVPLARGGPR